MKLSHIALATSALLTLNGCLKVKDNNNSEMVAQAIDKQTTAQQQLAAEQQKKQQLTLNGLVRGYQDSVDLTNAQVRLRIGNTLTEPVKVVDGAYTLTNVPKNSDIIVIVENKDKNVNFVTELFAIRTTAETTENTVQQLRAVTVAKPVTHKFQVLNVKDNTSIELTNVYGTTIATDKAHKLDAYILKASYDKTLAEYSIVLPANFTGSIVADLDLDKDNRFDYTQVQGSPLGFSTLFTPTTLSNGYVYLEPAVASYQEFTAQLKLIDKETGQSLAVPYVLLNNGLQAIQRATRSSDTSYYQAKIRYYNDSVFNISMPQFDTETKRYVTQNYSISKDSLGNFRVSGANSFTTAVVNGVLELTLPVEGVLKSTIIELSTVTKTLDNKTDTATMFFNLPVGLESDAFSLVTEGDVIVTPGSTAADTPAPGTTRITTAPAVTVPFSMLYNDTAAQLNLAALVKPGFTQRLYLNQFHANGNALNKLSGIKNTLSTYIDLPVKDFSTEFNPADIIIDNKNYSLAGTLANPKNTAGVNDNVSPNQPSYQLALLIPESALTLDNLQLKLSYQGRTVLSNNFQPTQSNYRTVLSLPSNETVENTSNTLLDTYSMQGLTVTGRYIYTYISAGLWLRDNTPTETVKMQLEYTYTSKAGVVKSGIIELPVR